MTFLATVFQYVAFIAGGNIFPGTMGEMSLETNSNAKLSFLRLIGCAYFKQHTSAFLAQTPRSLYYSVFDATTILDNHTKING